MPADLVGGGFQTYDPVWTILNRLPNATQGNVAARTNLHWFGIGNLAPFKAVTEKQYSAAIPVSWGESFSNVAIWGYAASGAAGFNFGAVYSGLEIGKEPVLLQQTTAKAEASTAEGWYALPLKEAVLATPTNAPNGFLYASFCCEEGTTTAEVVIATLKPKIAIVNGPSHTGAPCFSPEVVAQKAAKEAAAKLKTATPSEKVPIMALY